MTLVKLTNGYKAGLFKPGYSNAFETLFNTDQLLLKDMVSFIPAVNLAESDNEFHIELALPGFKKEDFKINLDQDRLIVTTEQEKENTEDSKKYSRREFSYRAFSRAFTLPETADKNNIQAEYIDGVLFIRIAKKEEAKIQSREISIK